jgi:hypothetical protein
MSVKKVKSLAAGGFQVLKAVTMKSIGFCVVIQCSAEKAQCLGGIYSFHLQG